MQDKFGFSDGDMQSVPQAPFKTSFNPSSFQFISTKLDGIETVKPHSLVI